MQSGFIYNYMSMDIETKSGSPLKYSLPKNGYDFDKELCEKYLELGQVYTLSRKFIHQSVTHIELAEFPNVKFNSVNFTNV